MPLKREPEAVSGLPLGKIEGETVVSNGCQLESKPRPWSYSSVLLIPYQPPATSTLPEGSSVAVWSFRPVPMLPVVVHVPAAGSYSSALLKEPYVPPATSTLPEGSSVAV